MFDLTTYVKKWRIRQLKTVFSTLDTLCTACLTGDKDPPGIFQGAWKYPGSWNFPGGLEISRT